jgi:two-component system chemotaxis sensor kinase CheA
MLDKSAGSTPLSQPGAAISSPSDEQVAQVTDGKSLAADEELITEFVTECGEHLANIETQLLDLEADNTATETLNAIFRGFHTIKGLAGFLEFEDIQALAHEIETLLDLARTSQLTVTPSITDVLLESTDILRHEIAGVKARLAGRTPLPTRVDTSLLHRIRRAATEDTRPHESPSIFRTIAESSTIRTLILRPSSFTAGIEFLRQTHGLR